MLKAALAPVIKARDVLNLKTPRAIVAVHDRFTISPLHAIKPLDGISKVAIFRVCAMEELQCWRLCTQPTDVGIPVLRQLVEDIICVTGEKEGPDAQCGPLRDMLIIERALKRGEKTKASHQMGP